MTEPTPRTFWRVFETVDGKESPCADMPRMTKKPDDFALAVADLFAAGRNVYICPVKFTAEQAISALSKGASAEEIQQFTGWSDEEMASILGRLERCGDIRD